MSVVYSDMNTIDDRLATIQEENRLGLMTHIVIGYPTLEKSKEIVHTMDEAGVDFVELQIPFSDPLADGPTIMRANKVALENGATVEKAFETMAELSKQVKIPLLFMTYFNIVHHYGVEPFCAATRDAGAAGLIVPDVPVDEEPREQFIKHAQEHDLVPIRLVSIVSTEERLKKNAPYAESFVYLVGRKSTTGAKGELDASLQDYLAFMKKHLDVPTAVGFGISDPDHIRALKGHARIAVVGSAVIDAYDRAADDENLRAVSDFITSLKSAA